jgi:monofunctional biosynthetic peptidoglycan transglycosylase
VWKREKVQEVSRRLKSRRWRRRALFLGLQIVAAFLVLTALPVLVLRVVPPLTSSFMIQREVGALLSGDRGFILRHHWVPLRQISREAWIAVVAAEDQKFPTHAGFDWKAIGEAIDESGGRRKPRGASTITQQVAKNLFLWSGRSFVRKGLEAWYTVLIEALWPKRRILEVYLNIAEFGPGVFGVGAASEHYFGKPPSQLGRWEASLLAAVLPSPKKYRVAQPGPYVLDRAAQIERTIGGLGGPGYLAQL